MPNVKEIRSQLGEIGVPMLVRGTLGNELIPLAQALGTDERVLAFVAGRWNGKKAVLAATATRVVFASGGLLGGATEVVYYDKIKDIEVARGHIEGEISVDGRKFGRVRADTIQPFMDTINQLRVKKEAPASRGDVAAELEKLKSLFDAGALSEEEFVAAKRRVLEG